MVRGIEHRSIEGVMNAYELYGSPNFGLFSGRELMIAYAGGNQDEGAQKLQEFLTLLEQGGSSTVYTLYIYDEGVRNINNKTPYVASTTFMLNANTAVKTEGGVTVIDRSTPAPAGQGNNAIILALQNENKELHAEIRKLQAQVLQEKYRADMTALESRVNAQIAGTKEDDKPWYDKYLDKLSEDPSNIGKILRDIKGVFLGEEKNYIIQQPEPQVTPMAGTQEQHTEGMPNETTTETKAGPLENPFIKPEEKNLSDKQQTELLLQRLKVLTDEQHEEVQNECLVALEERIGHITLSRMLLAVAGMNDKDLNKLIGHLD